MGNEKVVAIIPARYGSTRLPGKPLININGMPMVLHVYTRAKELKGINEVAVATDHEKILETVIEAGGKAFMTDPSHPSGTDRIAEVARLLNLAGSDIVINIQGDQPFFQEDMIYGPLKLLQANKEFAMTTVACPMTRDMAADPNRVKVILDSDKRAIYFSRSCIPYDRDNLLQNKDKPYLRHLGLYVFRNSFLQTFVKLPPSKLEKIECLEQLRAIENGYSIGVALIDNAPLDVDTEEDLKSLKEG